MTDPQAARRAQIEAAAFEVLEKVGFKKASMLQIAKQAKASNETLYAWYGNKQALFSALIASNAQAVDTALSGAIDTEGEADDALSDHGRLLLQFTATQKAIIINRAAIADVQDTGLLAEAIAENALRPTLRLIERLMTKLAASGRYRFDDGPQAAAEVFVSLLLGDLQMRQALGAASSLSEAEIDARSARATDLFNRLYRAR